MDIEEFKKKILNPFNCISISTKNTMLKLVEALEQQQAEIKARDKILMKRDCKWLEN